MSEEAVKDFYPFRPGPIWAYLKTQPLSLWAVCGYLFIEFTRPQSLYPALDVLPWAQTFLLLSLVGALADKDSKYVKSLADFYLVCFCLLVTLSTLNAEYPLVSQATYINFFIWFIVYFIITSIVNNRVRFYVFMLVFIFSSAKIAIGTSKLWVSRGFSFTAWGLSGPPGYFQDSGELAVLMLMFFPVAFYFWRIVKQYCNKFELLLCTLFWVCPILTILGSSSRGSQIGLFVQLLIMFRRQIWNPRYIFILVISFIALWHLLPDEQKERFSDAGDDKSSLQRILYWEHGMDMIQEYPWLGVGFFNFVPYYAQNFPGDILYTNAQEPHNIFIQVGTDAGIPALIMYILLILYCFRASRRICLSEQAEPMDKAFAAGLGVGILGFLVAGQFVTIAYYPFLWIALPMIVCLENIVGPKKNWKYRTIAPS